MAEKKRITLLLLYYTAKQKTIQKYGFYGFIIKSVIPAKARIQETGFILDYRLRGDDKTAS
jgi:hypothetical protein